MSSYSRSSYRQSGFDLGPITIPPMPPIAGMTDRTTGKIWYLCYDPSVTNHMCLVDTLPLNKLLTIRVFGPWDGPYIENFGLRMGLDQYAGQTHVVFDRYPTDSGPGPYGFQLTGGNQNTAQVFATTLHNPNFFDHLYYVIETLKGQ